MKKILLFNILLVLCSLGTQAQTYVPFPTHDAVWTEVYRPHGDSAWRMSYYALKNNDTTIAGNVYHKLYYSPDTIFDEQEYYMAIREDNQQKVYAYANGDEVLMYDFSVEEGDTVYQNANGGMNNWNLDMIVSSVDSVEINGVFRRRINLGHPSNPSANFYSAWVDGIGNFVRGLTFPSGTYPINGVWAELVCFRQNNVLELHHMVGQMHDELAFPDCFHAFTENVPGIPTEKVSNIVPNPVRGYGYLLLNSKADFEKLAVYDILGRNVMSAEVRQMDKVTIDATRLKPGMYSYLLTGKNGQRATGKFLVQ